MSAFPGLSPEAVYLLSFRVSDAVRRPKVVGARTRGSQATVYGNFDLRLILWIATAYVKR